MEGQPARIGRYRLIRKIGRGGMGEVHLARFESKAGVRRLAAVKILRDTVADDQNKKGLLAEARLAALVTHPNVVHVLDADIEHGVPWLAMEYVPGMSLHELIAMTALPPWVCARIMADLCGGVHAVHRATDERGRPLHIVHRDITPHNVLVSWDGIVKLADFGVARSELQSNMTRAGILKGKLGYMSPEQAGGAPVDQRSDIFALGIVLWEALSRTRLFAYGNNSETLAAVLRCEIRPLRVIAPEVPEPLVRITERALAARPAERFSSALELGRALTHAISESGTLTGPAEVAHFLASVAPERVREHEGWLADVSDTHHAVPAPPSSKDGKTEALLPAKSKEPSVPGTHHALVTGESQALRRRRSWASFFLGAIVVGSATVAVAYGPSLLSPAASRSVPVPTAPLPVETVARSPTAIATSKPTAIPTPDPASPSAVAIAATSAVPPRLVSEPVGTPTPPPRPPEPAGTGTLNVSARPSWATVRIDGRSYGSTPTVIRNLHAGSHSIEALPRGKGPGKRRTVTISRDKVSSVEFVFD